MVIVVIAGVTAAPISEPSAVAQTRKALKMRPAPAAALDPALSRLARPKSVSKKAAVPQAVAVNAAGALARPKRRRTAVEHFAGLDVGTHLTSVCVIDAKGETVFEAEIATDPDLLTKALKKWRATLRRVGHEAGSMAPWLHAELEAAGFGRVYAGVYRHDAIPWCGLFMAIVAHRANIERRPERNPPRLYLSALEWAAFGMSVPKGAAALGDVLVFKRKGGGHVGLYVGHDASAFHVLGGNQQNRVSITRLSRNRLVAVRRPAYRAQPANVRPIALAASGSLSVNEA